MEEIKVTLEEARDFGAMSSKYLEEFSDDTKIRYALIKVSKQVNEAFKDYNKEANAFNAKLEDIRIDNAATNEKGILIKSSKEGEYEYTQEGHAKMRTQIREAVEKWTELSEILLKKPVTITPHYIIDEKLIDLIPYKYRPYFKRFILKDDGDTV